MPHTRHQRSHRQDDVRNNNPQAPAAAQEREVAGAECAVHAANQPARENDNAEARLQRCCTPGACRSPDEKIDPEDPNDAVKVVCNNETCHEGCWMHKDCFEEFEQSVLSYLRSCGRARSWSEKQRLQNLWTKKGYDLAFKACDCRCGRGHLRKDLNYIPPPFSSKKQKRSKKKNDKPMPVVSTTHKSNSHSCQVNQMNGNVHQTATHAGNSHGHQYSSSQSGRSLSTVQKGKKPTTTTKLFVHKNDNSQFQHLGAVDNQAVNSITSSNHSTSLFASNFNSHLILGALPGVAGNPQLRLRTNSVSSTGSAGSHSSSSSSSIPGSAGSASPISSSPVSGDMFFKSRKSSDASSDSAPLQIGFRQRIDLSAFAALPRNKQNAYHIHLEDPSTLAHAFSLCALAAPKVPPVAELASEAGSCDAETRNFVLGNLLNKKMYSTRCALCKAMLPVFDRFPLLDGTFFLSPQSYDEAAIQVIWDGRLQFLNAVCLSCLEGHCDIKCAACKVPWDGRNLVIGSMYTYDIFAAAPCCQKRLTCKCCRRAVVDITKGLDFYSQYSQMVICPYCKANDYHFIRSLTETFLVCDEGAGFTGPICHQ